MSTALLIIDELGFEVMSREEASLFFRLITYRYDRGAILITTSKSVRDWTELLAGDEVLAAAILDRLLHRSNVLNIKGRSLPAAGPRGHPQERTRLKQTVRCRPGAQTLAV
ncbi:MAG: ATP-binding protein, partial [Pseudomonadota bacterium]